MQIEDDIRWKQRFNNYRKALSQLSSAVELAQSRPLSQLEEQGLIQAYEFTYELAWNVLRDYLQYAGISGLIGSRDTVREAFSAGLISDGERWMQMLRDRNLAAHTYDESTAHEIREAVISVYHILLCELRDKMETLIKDALWITTF